MASSINDFQNVKIVDNLIIPQRFFYVVTDVTEKSEFTSEFVPSELFFSEGVWKYRVGSIFVDNFTSTLKSNYRGVFDLKTNLHRTYVKRTNFSSDFTTIITVPVSTVSGYYFLPNLQQDWYPVSSRPYNTFETRISLKAGMPSIPKGVSLRFEVEFLFQRIK